MGYDEWLLKQADEYCSGCEPKVIKVEKEYEGCEPDGTPVFSEAHVLNCEECNEKECEHWLEYNEGEPCHICGELTGLNCYDCDQPLCEKCKCDCELQDQLKNAKGKEKRKIRRQLRKLRLKK